MSDVKAFLRESLKIEGINRQPTKREVEATEAFLASKAPAIPEIVTLVRVYQPDARLRDIDGLNVRVGDHVPPSGGPHIVTALSGILHDIRYGADPWETHLAYEMLHPFTDGNGRSGRAIWAWQMIRRQSGLPLQFLHQFYYQTLARGQPKAP